jgi:GTPase
MIMGYSPTPTSSINPTNVPIPDFAQEQKTNVIDAREKFRTMVPFSAEEEVVSLESKGYTFSANVPILVNPGEKVTVKLYRELIGVTSTSQSTGALNKTNINTDLVPKEELKKMEEKVEELLKQITSLTDIIEEKDSNIQEESRMRQDPTLKALSYVHNTAIIISLLLTITFTVFLTFNLFIPKTDALFAFILSSMGAFFFFLDKQWRRVTNK